jgi:hypothetical protein
MSKLFPDAVPRTMLEKPTVEWCKSSLENFQSTKPNRAPLPIGGSPARYQ